MSESLPSITLIILTHARSRLLGRALHSALAQDYGGRWDVLVVNDCPEQRLSIDDQRVTVINEPRVVGSVGAKRNLAVSRATGEWVAWLDDDDVLLRGHLSKIRFALRAGKDCLASSRTLWFCEEKMTGEITSAALADYLTRRDALVEVRFDDVSCGEDDRLWKTLLASNRSVPDPGRPTYAQVWCNGSFHVTGAGWTPDAHLRFRRNALERLGSREEPSGSIRVQPDAGVDYARLAKPILDAWALTAHPEESL